MPHSFTSYEYPLMAERGRIKIAKSMFYMESPELSFAACVTSHFCFLRNKKLAVHMKNRHPCPNNNHILRNDAPFVYKLQVSIDG